MRRIFIRIFLFGWLIAGALSGCASRAPGKDGGSNPPPVATHTPPAVVPSARTAAAPTLTSLPLPSATAQLTPTTEKSAAPKAPSGWTVFSNPDYVQALIVHDNHLWTATRGGVVDWDLATKSATLFTTRDGLAEIQANDIVYCSIPAKRILVAHPSGVLSAYDMALKKWSRLAITFEDGSTLHEATRLFCDASNQRLLVGASDGLAVLDEKSNRWKRFGPVEGLKTSTIRAIGVAGQAIWVAAGEKGAFLISGSTVFPFTGTSGFPSGSINDLSVGPDSSVWFGYSTGLVHYKEMNWSSYGSQAPTGIPFRSVDYIHVGPDKRVWIASVDGGVCPFDPVTLFCSTVYPAFHDAPITSLTVDQSGVAYAGTDGAGVRVLDADKVSILQYQQNGLLSNDVMDIAEDPSGKLWVATDHGVNIVNIDQQDGPWTALLPGSGRLAFPQVLGLLPVRDGIWFSYDQESQASFYNGGSWLHLDALKGMAGEVMDMAVDQRGYIWFATNQGIKVWDGTLVRSYVPPLDIPGNVFRALLADENGMWIGTDRGLLRYERFQWSVKLPDIAINTIVPDQKGGLLLGTDQGLVHFDGSQSFFWIINFGSEVLANARITSIAWDRSQQLWVGTESYGLFRYGSGRWERFNTTNGLPTNHVRKVFTDHLGEVWIATTTDKGGGALSRYVP